MADIHIGESVHNPTKNTVDITVYFHVPHNTATNSYPGGQVSELSGLDQAEIDGLMAGALVEVKRSLRYSLTDLTKIQIRDNIRGKWSNVASRLQADYNNRYSFYGTELARL